MKKPEAEGVERASSDGIKARGLRDKSVHTGSCGSLYAECGRLWYCNTRCAWYCLAGDCAVQ